MIVFGYHKKFTLLSSACFLAIAGSLVFFILSKKDSSDSSVKPGSKEAIRYPSHENASTGQERGAWKPEQKTSELSTKTETPANKVSSLDTIHHPELIRAIAEIPKANAKSNGWVFRQIQITNAPIKDIVTQLRRRAGIPVSFELFGSDRGDISLNNVSMDAFMAKLPKTYEGYAVQKNGARWAVYHTESPLQKYHGKIEAHDVYLPQAVAMLVVKLNQELGGDININAGFIIIGQDVPEFESRISVVAEGDAYQLFNQLISSSPRLAWDIRWNGNEAMFTLIRVLPKKQSGRALTLDVRGAQ